MLIHSSQIGLVLQNGFVFLGEHFHRWVYVLNNFTKWFGCFSEKWKTPAFLQGILLNGFIVLGGDLARDWGWLYKMVLVLFEKTTNTSTKWFVIFWGKFKLIDSKMIESYRMVYNIPGNLKLFLQNGLQKNATQWFLNVFPQNIHLKPFCREPSTIL